MNSWCCWNRITAAYKHPFHWTRVNVASFASRLQVARSAVPATRLIRSPIVFGRPGSNGNNQNTSDTMGAHTGIYTGAMCIFNDPASSIRSFFC